MTAEEKSNNPEIVEEARRLKIKSWHLKPLEQVKKEIDEAGDSPIVVPVSEPKAKVEKPQPVRSVAPKMPLAGIGVDSRRKLLAELDAKEPGVKHLFQPANLSDEDLLAKGFERTGITLKNDIVVRTDAERYDQIRNLKMAHHRKMMNSIDTEGEKIVSLTEQPKKGKT